MPGKYHARKIRAAGYVFDSVAEHRRYCELILLERAKRIENLRIHPKHDLTVNGEKIGAYSPDFSYFEIGRGMVYEDCKSSATMTPVSSLKIRVFQALLKTQVVLIGKNIPKPRKFRSAA